MSMTKHDLPYAAKFSELEPFYTPIFTTVKKDLRDEHLRTDKGFFKRNFTGRELNKLTVDDLLAVYPKLIAAGYEPLSEFIANRWLLRNLGIYNYFEARLKQCTEKFEQIEVLDVEFAKSLMEDAVSQFGAQNTYIFSVLNCVAFPADMMKELRTNAINMHASATTTPA
jgi:hypothetical protein